MKLGTIRKVGVVGSAMFFLANIIFPAASGLDPQTQFLVFLVPAGLGTLFYVSAISEAAREARKRAPIDYVIGAYAASGIARMAMVLITPKLAPLSLLDYAIYLRLPPTDVSGLAVYVITLGGSLVYATLYFRTFSSLSQAFDDRYFRFAGIAFLLGAALSIEFGSIFSVLAVIVQTLGFAKIGPVRRENSEKATKSFKSGFTEVWFTNKGVFEVSVFYANVFYLYVLLAIPFGYGADYSLQILGLGHYVGPYSWLYSDRTPLSSALGVAMAAITALAISRRRYPEFSIDMLMAHSRMKIDWSNIKAIRSIVPKLLTIETDDESLEVRGPEDPETLAALAGPRLHKSVN